ncbi:GNAT family N-acetyltransferase [Streptomyces ipomoeae]|uniref:Acetyltransferase, GNAT family n=2 Tax=Streptomyces ipomoeae TaxID=103232 RepID=L1L7I1_9ACTN|nr:GNAT family N-acetyltransferase [Streptomyces ipomoeae]EKX68754.1 acetyltransferase, GNAT family [Streptomyces ipomoeae 91-03]MDX2697507.1 GNAT family N-acetyltransferase [Streptomyces ipomoeae]MDX2837796.1 GNAT family N-acetyltransferase [Streptomyces ipomoeae]
MVIKLRDLSLDDIPAWHRLRAEIEEEVQTGEHGSVEEDAEEFARTTADGRGAVVGAFDGAELVGYFSVNGQEPTGSIQSVQLNGGVTPRRHAEGIGSLLFPAMLRRGREIHAEHAPDVPVRFDITGNTDDTAQAALFTAHGFLPQRWSVLMRHGLTDLPDMPPLPEGFTLADADPARDATQLLTAHNEAFKDQPGAALWSADDWQEIVVDKSQVRWDLSSVVTSGDEVAAYLHTEAWPVDDAAAGAREGWIARLGTLRAHRGRGLATALLLRALHACAADGLTAVELEVDPKNPTDPLKIYARAGFAVKTRLAEYRLTEN